jgi:hypothetical protein
MEALWKPPRPVAAGGGCFWAPPFPAPLRCSGSRGCPLESWTIKPGLHTLPGGRLGCPSSDGGYRDRDAQSQLRLLRGEDGRKEEPDRQDEARSAGMKMKADFG